MNENDPSSQRRKTSLVLILVGGFFLALIILAVVFVGMKSSSSSPVFSYKVDTVSFSSKPYSSPEGPVPGIWIDTNTKLKGLFGGTITTTKPYSISFDYTDNTFSLEKLEFVTIRIVYDDGIVEPALKDLDLPIAINSRIYESLNSTNTGTVKTSVRLLSGRIPGVITRDKPFTLHIEGKFTKEDGKVIPFKIERHYDIKKEDSTKSWFDVFKNA